MPRQARIDAPGALHHIIARGIERRKLFDDDQDRYDFAQRLGFILEATRTECYAWALIPNHFHLLLCTSTVPVATVMRRLLTGHAIYYNRRHCRQGQLFQNRYKSILCQEDAHFAELVRYIHLNPLRAGLVKDLNHLSQYPFSGHGVLLGRFAQSWQNVNKVLSIFGTNHRLARRDYRDFVAQGQKQGNRTDLTGGGLIRSAGGWAAVQALGKAGVHVKSDERILGDGDFVTKVLSQGQESLDRRYRLQAKGVDIDYIARRVAQVLDMPVADIWLPGKYQRLVKARSLLCYWAVRELGMSMAAMARRLNISTVAVSKSVERGRRIYKEKGYRLI